MNKISYKATAEDLKRIFEQAKGKQLESLTQFQNRISEEDDVIAPMPDNVEKLMYGNAFDDFFRLHKGTI